MKFDSNKYILYKPTASIMYLNAVAKIYQISYCINKTKYEIIQCGY